MLRAERPTPSILLVEDDIVDAEAFKRCLQQEQCSVPLFVARDGVEALRLLRGEDGTSPLPWPLVICLDLNMPRVNGLEFLAELRKDSQLRSLVVFVLTSSDATRDKLEAYNYCIAGYLLKPMQECNLRNVIVLLKHYLQTVVFPERRHL